MCPKYFHVQFSWKQTLNRSNISSHNTYKMLWSDSVIELHNKKFVKTFNMELNSRKWKKVSGILSSLNFACYFQMKNQNWIHSNGPIFYVFLFDCYWPTIVNRMKIFVVHKLRGIRKTLRVFSRKLRTKTHFVLTLWIISNTRFQQNFLGSLRDD